MADEEHLRTLELGPDAWNAWREANPDVRPDLTAAEPRGARARHVRRGAFRPLQRQSAEAGNSPRAISARPC